MASLKRSARRALTLALLTALALAPVACVFGGGSHSAELAQPSALWAAPAHYENKLVRTTGVVEGFLLGTSNEHYVVEDAAPHRVQLLDVDHARLAAMAGKRVAVVGTFHFSDTRGYTIDVQSISVVG